MKKWVDVRSRYDGKPVIQEKASKYKIRTNQMRSTYRFGADFM